MALKYIPVKTTEQINELADMAHTIWNEYWPDLIGQAQVDYMVEKFQSKEAIERGIKNTGYEYWFLEAQDDEGARIVGYTGGHVEPETNRFFISKIYLYKDERGKHFASDVIAFYENLCKERGLEAMYLTVNKDNVLGIRAYEAKGFKTIEEAETDIGEGFIMDDYIMEKKVDATS